MRVGKIRVPSYSPLSSIFTSKSFHLSFSSNSPSTPIDLPFHLPLSFSDLFAINNQNTFAAALSFSWRNNSPVLGSRIHGQIIKSGFSADTFSQNNLLTMYSKCREVDHASKVFDEMADRNLVSWTSMISGFVHNNEHEKGFNLYIEMMRAGFVPNEFSLASVMSACGVTGRSKFGNALHSVALKIGMDTNRFVGSTLLWMYAKCGNIEAAELAFEIICDPDLACWNAIIEGYALNGDIFNAMKSFSFASQIGLNPDQCTYISTLKGCQVIGDLRCGQTVHCVVIRNEFQSNTTVMNSLADMYFRTGRKNSALKVFHQICIKDNSSWNTAICGLAKEEEASEVVNLFSTMLSAGVRPDQITLSTIIRLCGTIEDLQLGSQFFCFACRLGYLNCDLVVNSLIKMLSRCDMMDSAALVFAGHPHTNLIICNEMIVGYTLNGFCTKAFQVFCSLIEHGIEGDEFTYSSILGACLRMEHQSKVQQIHARIIKLGLGSCCSICSSMVTAYASFGAITSCYAIFKDAAKLDLVSWGAMISAFVKLGFNKEGLLLLNCLRDTYERPDEIILSSALRACANLALLDQSMCIHSYIVKIGFENCLSVATAMINSYAKSGEISSSKDVFKNMSRDYKDVILFNTMIMAYAHHGLITEAIELFQQMKSFNIHPTHATFVAVIATCSHQGLVKQGEHLFDSISSVYGMYPSTDNFACLVDLFARNGLLEKAKNVIESMPYEPWPALWISLLSGCRIYGNKDMAELAAEKVLQLTPNNDSAYALMANVYAGDAKWKDAERMRFNMEINRVDKTCGYSIIAT
ncbi:pentatricopeptide repeat-containing protein At3g09040, mitochondrial-like [Zingiber officinale]|uniref:Pentatricopeptide repeat-containing protein n=1 Tax=Zingiber officinale TaxID=94328 RepID=A0A8J5IBR0_ZINOF|nr:pentatricopeptide repeat-containing protein At3g09040, mitochondrial-like [Zingiber officinale]KAG6532126.1 hypothetical protein ZIOFF_005964 [Zingiber officinale]